jgi:hypothetical protein
LAKLQILFLFESHDAFYRFLANQRNIQILDVEHEKIRDSCQALFRPMPKLEEGLILRLICRQSNRNLPEYNRRAFGKKWSKNAWLICRASGWFIASSKESPNRFICSHVYHSCCFNRIENIKSEFIRRQGSVYKYIFTHCTWAIAIFNIPNWNWK